jgi:hypothetical protein
MKTLVNKEMLLAYPDFNQPFGSYTDASDLQLGAVISQNGKPIAFYPRKLTKAQKNYTVTERELLAIVETLKEFHNILLGQQLRVYTDHLNLTRKTANTLRVMRWRLFLEEYGPAIIYIKGEKNIVADALSRLDRSEGKEQEENLLFQNAQLFHMEEDLPPNAFPLKLKTITKYQQQDKQLLEQVQKDNKNNYSLNIFCGGGKERKVICKNDKIVKPKMLQEQTVQ